MHSLCLFEPKDLVARTVDDVYRSTDEERFPCPFDDVHKKICIFYYQRFEFMPAFINTSLTVTSPDFRHNGNIPSKYTCEGKGINPTIVITNFPEGTKSLVLIVDDPDAKGRTFDHWIVWNIPPGEVIKENSVPGVQGKNGAGENSYIGPCPPTGTHRYFFKAYALNTMMDIMAGAEKQTIEKAMQKHILASTELIGLYERINKGK
jgi:Raf kinase inhibitor-like YbhB/YbcL family protein